MRRPHLALAFALSFVVAARASTLAAQSVPGRDLLQLPLGTIDRAAALPGGIGDGAGNPAAIRLDSAERWRVGIAALQTPSQQAVDLRMVAASGVWRDRTIGLSVVHAYVGDLYVTTTDPQTISGLGYNTTLTSLAVAQPIAPHVTGGLALRYRTGQLGGDRRGTLGVDGGLVVDHLPLADLRLAAASFLWRPINSAVERPALNLAADLRAIAWDGGEARLGYAASFEDGAGHEDFVFGAGRLSALELRLGAVRTSAYGASAWRSRLGVILHVDQYSAGVAREEGIAGLEPIYQFTLSATLR